MVVLMGRVGRVNTGCAVVKVVGISRREGVAGSAASNLPTLSKLKPRLAIGQPCDFIRNDGWPHTIGSLEQPERSR